MNYPRGAKILVISSLACGLTAVPPPTAADSGWFLTGSVGPSFVNNLSLTGSVQVSPGPGSRFRWFTAQGSFKTGVRLDLDGGYQFNDSWALKAESGFIYNSVDFATRGASASTSLYQVPLLVNGIYTVPVKWRIKPYVGSGMGGVETGLNSLHDMTAAGELLAGLKFKLNSRIDVGLGYKLLVTAKHDWNDFLDTTQSSRTVNNSMLADVTFKF